MHIIMYIILWVFIMDIIKGLRVLKYLFYLGLSNRPLKLLTASASLARPPNPDLIR